MKKITIFMHFFLSAAALYAQPDNLKFNHLTVDNGLSESKVQCILKDRDGFMWFGTGYKGLNRYDGSKFIVYKCDPENENSFANAIINCLYEDREANLWVGTMYGLSLYDRMSDRFSNTLIDTGASLNAGLSNVINEIFQDRDGGLWIGTADGLFRYDRTTPAFVPFRHNPSNPNSLSNNNVTGIAQDQRGLLWVCTLGGGLNAMDPRSGMAKRYTSDPSNPLTLSSDFCTSMYDDKQGSLWILTQGGGLNRMDLKTEIFTRYRHDESNPNSISVDMGWGLTGDGKGTLFIGTENGGLNVFDIKQERFTRYFPKLEDPASINSISCPAPYYDADGTLWVGTVTGGVNYSSPYLHKFTLVKNTELELSNSVVLGFSEDAKGNIWICTDGGGLNYWDRTVNRFSYYRHKPKDPASIGSDAVLSIFEDSRNRLWVGTYLGGLNLLDRSSGRFTRFLHNQSDAKSLPNNSVRKIFEDRQKNIWVATDSGLVRMNPDGKTFTSASDICGSNMLMTDLTAAVEDKQGRIWFGGYGTDLYCIDPNKRTVKQYISDPGNPKSLKSSHVLNLYVDTKGTLWIGTSYSLDRFNTADSTFDHFTPQSGLPDGKIVSIMEDDGGNLWLGTGKGLSKFKDAIHFPAHPEFHNYDIGDRLQGREFRVGSCLKTKEGELLFGGNNGFNIFNPGRVLKNPIVPRIAITGFKLFNKNAIVGDPHSPLRRHITYTDLLELSYKHTVITFEFSALNFLLPEKNQYAYMMEGFEKEWNYVGTKQSATYTNLDPGEYIFRVKGSNNDGVWNEAGSSIHIVISPPFWQTIWFKLIVVLVIVGIVYLAYRRQVEKRRIAEQLRMDKAIARERTLLRTLIDNMPDYVYVKDSEGKFIVGNSATAHQLGFVSENELLGKTDFDLFPREAAEKLFADEQKILQSGKGFYEYEGPAVDPNKETKDRWISTTKVPFLDSQGKIIGTVGIGRDITERKRIEEEREILIAELQNALADVKVLSGLVPICSNCKKIRDDSGFWNQLELYIQKHSQAKFSHGICPDCMKLLYPDIEIKKEEEEK